MPRLHFNINTAVVLCMYTYIRVGAGYAGRGTHLWPVPGIPICVLRTLVPASVPGKTVRSTGHPIRNGNVVEAGFLIFIAFVLLTPVSFSMATPAFLMCGSSQT